MKPLLIVLVGATLVISCTKKSDPSAKKKPQVQQAPQKTAPKTVTFCGKQLPIETTTKAYCRGQATVQASNLTPLTKLRLLDVSETKRLDALNTLAKLPNLKELSLFKTQVKINHLAQLSQLRELKIIHAPYAKTLSPIIRLKHLTYLRCSHCALSDITFVAKLPRLRALTLSHTPSIQKFQPIGTLKELRYLNLSGTQVADLSWITTLTNLEKLFLASTKIKDLRPLVQLTQLRELTLSSKALRDISALPKLKNLDRLNLRGNPNLRRLTPLHKMAWLKVLTIPAKALTKRQLARLKNALPRTNVRTR